VRRAVATIKWGDDRAPDRLQHDAVLAAVKEWPGEGGGLR
jgi:hypothetical protein